MAAHEFTFSEAEQAGGLSFSDENFFGVINTLGFYLPSKSERVNNRHFTALLDCFEFMWRRTRGTFAGYVYRHSTDSNTQFSMTPCRQFMRDGTLATFAGQNNIALVAGSTRYIWIDWSVPATPVVAIGAAWPAADIVHTRVEAIACPASGPWLDQHRTRFLDAQAVIPFGAIVGSVAASGKIAFAYNTASPLKITTVPAGCTVLRAKVRIDTPFNGTSPVLTIGDAGNTSRLMIAGDNDPKTAETYTAEIAVDYAAATDINLYITPSTSSAGAGKVLLEFAP